jgi:hypothetical protein
MNLEWVLESGDWLQVGAVGRPVGVDRKANVLRGYVVMQEGPLKTPGRGEIDEPALQAIVRLGNAEPKGVKSRFTHPDMSNDGLGKYLGRSRDLAMDTAIDARTKRTVLAVRADLHFDPTALAEPVGGGIPLGTYVMDLAESDPDAVSSSVVMRAKLEYRLNDDGTRKIDANGDPLPPLFRPTELHASDVVDTGDAVDGILSADPQWAGLWRVEQVLERSFDGSTRREIEERCGAFLRRFLDRKFGPDVDVLRRRLALRGKSS